MDRDHRGLGVRGDGWGVYVDCVRQQRRAFESGGDSGIRGAGGKFLRRWRRTLRRRCWERLVGAALVWLHYLPHWKETPDAGAKLACFCTAPAIREAAANLVSEIIGTFVLVFVVGAIFSKSVAATGPGALGPYLVGSLVWGIGLVAGRNDRLCDQSGARFWAAPGARDFADCGEGWVGLGLRRNSGDRAAGRRSAGGMVAKSARSRVGEGSVVRGSQDSGSKSAVTSLSIKPFSQTSGQ